MPKPSPVYVFLHVPKTGGSTINAHLRQHLEYDSVFVHLGGDGELYRQEAGLEPWEDRSDDDRNRARVLTGHRSSYGIHKLVPGRPARYLTIQREPAARIMSTYNFRMQRFGLDLSFEDWYAGFARNKAFKWMRQLLDLRGTSDFAPVADRIRTFWFVGVTEHLDDDLPYLFDHFGVPSDTWQNQRVAIDNDARVAESLSLPTQARWQKGNPTLKRMELTPDLRERINQDNKRDLKLYELALRRRARTLDNLHGT